MNLIDKLSKLEKHTRYSVFIIILFSIIVFSLASAYHVSGDGCWHASVGKYIGKSQKIPLFEPLGREEPFWSPPLYHMIAAGVYSLSNLISSDFADFAAKFVSPVFSVLALIFSFLTIRKLFNSKIAFYSTVFLASIPIFLDYSIFSYVESTLTFFVVLSIYFMVSGKIALSGIAAGLSILTKYNGAFVLPVLVFILYKKQGKNRFYKNAAIVIGLSLLIASPWLLRNWVLLGNPIWPFLNFAFNGYESRSFSSLNLNNIIDPDLYVFTYMGIFGVPDGNYRALAMVNLPYFEILFFIWMAGTFIFSLPFIVGILNFKNIRKSYKNYDIGIILVLSYLILFFMYAANVGFSVSRMLLPALPAFALFWASGFEKMIKNRLFRKMAIFLLTAVIIGFVLAEFVKIKYASDSWNIYKEDFDWARHNTNPEAIFIAEGQCIPYNLERTSIYATEENLKKADYVWINQGFKLDVRSVLTDEKIGLIRSKNYKVAYEHKKTGTLIYETR